MGNLNNRLLQRLMKKRCASITFTKTDYIKQEMEMGRYDLIDKKKSSWLLPVTLAIMLVIIAVVFIFVLPQNSEKTENDTGDQFMEILDVPSEENPPVTNQDSVNRDISSTEQTADKIGMIKNTPLPPLDDSDTLFRKDLSYLSPGLNTWLVTDQLVRKFMVISNDFSQGLRVYKHFRFFKLEQPFIAKETLRGYYMPRKSYQRYDQLAAAIDAMDVAQSLALYKKYSPLFEQVFAEFSYPESYKLDDIFKNAAAQILAAPIISEQIRLVRPTVRYKYADPELEALNPVQKQMLRMGPENTRKIQKKLRLFLEALANSEET